MKAFLASLPIGAALAAGWALPSVEPIVHPRTRPPGLEVHETHAAATLLGQFRTSLSSWLWLRADLYVHNGVEMRPLSELEIEAGREGVGSTDNEDGALHDDSKIVTVIPPPERDFRGLFGEIERRTKTYKDMRGHTHSDPYLALPLFRLMVWVDPQFVAAWTTGASILARDRSPAGYLRARDFLREGLRKNPDSAAILADLGALTLTRADDRDQALAYLEQAREEGRRRWPRLPEDDMEGLLAAYRWLTLLYRDLGRPDLQVARAREGLRFFPDDPLLRRQSSPQVSTPEASRQGGTEVVARPREAAPGPGR